VAQEGNDLIREMLADPSKQLSTRHRAALEYKIGV
jgi:hypothetical protein